MTDHLDLDAIEARAKAVVRYEVEGLRETFATREYAEEAAAKIEAIARAKAMLQEGATLGDIFDVANEEFPSLILPRVREHHPDLADVTKDTGFEVSHWQGSKKRCYRIVDFSYPFLRPSLWGSGGWTGAYGDDVEWRELYLHRASDVD